MKLLYCEPKENVYDNGVGLGSQHPFYTCYYEEGEEKDLNHVEMLVEIINQQAQCCEKVEMIQENVEELKGDYDTNTEWNFTSSASCSGGEEESYSGGGTGIRAIFDLLFFLIEQYERLRGIMCGVQPCLAMPEHYQIPLEAHRPQLVLQFAEVNEKGDDLISAKHVITIPHYIGRQDDPAPVDFYKKGNYRGKLTLRDNSKVHAYGDSQFEAFRVLKQIKEWIDPDMLDGAHEQYDSFPSANIKQVRVYPKYASYWPTGAKENNPAWTVRYSFDG